jgi:adenosylhomocysteine nucleosidase
MAEISLLLRRACTIAGIMFGAASAALAQAAPDSPRPLLIQGALTMETSRLVAAISDVKIETVGGWTFWRGTLNGYPIIISRTRMGGVNAAAATALAIERYNPAAIINQGTAGGHDAKLEVGDIVIGASAVSIAAFKTPRRAAGKGSSPLDWVPTDVSGTDEDLHEGKPMRIRGDSMLLATARRVRQMSPKLRVTEGVIASSDVWNEEIDRVSRLHSQFGTSVEEMETAPVAQIARSFKIPFIGIRVVTANVTNGGAYDAKTSDACQDFVLQVVRAYLPTLDRRRETRFDGNGKNRRD